MDPATRDTFDAWWALRQGRGSRLTLVDLYAREGRRRGTTARGLPAEVRDELRTRFLAAVYPGIEERSGSARDAERVELSAADPTWVTLFDHWCRRIVDAVGPVARRVEHVGSTSVPGLDAKPVVDVQVSVEDQEDEEAYVPGLASLGLVLRSREDHSRFLRPRAGLPRDVHVRVCDLGGAWERDHLLFRDYLRNSAPARERYLAVKRAAQRDWADDRIAYTETKTAVILDQLAEAEHWAAARGWTP